MNLNIERFTINGLFGARNYNIEIKENKIVMVGVNGLGKTTVVTLLYLLLSRQWERALEFDFDSVTIRINGVDYAVKQERADEKTLVETISTKLRSNIQRAIAGSGHRLPLSNETYERLALIALNEGPDTLGEELDRLLPIPTQLCKKLAAESIQPRSFNKSALSRLDGFLAEQSGNYQVLYLPTYRRVEKELALIFPDLEESIQTFQRRKGAAPGQVRRGFVELVEFGMEDVENTFRRARFELVERAKSELSNLAGGYLRDVIRGEGEAYETSTFSQLNDSTINRILNRAEEQTLSETDKIRLRAVIDKIRRTSSSGLEPVDRYIAHFFSKLINVDTALSEREELIARFIGVCNKYLAGKEIVYDDKESSIKVRLTRSKKPLALKFLSSGEKQIVSLFSHLYLRERGDVLVIIDEPELSLSVRWQEQLLPDIIETGKCRFLAAVTHSPFIFSNFLDPHAVNLADCITEIDA